MATQTQTLSRAVGSLSLSGSSVAPLEPSGVLDQYEPVDLTPVLGRQFDNVQLKALLEAPNSDELIKELAITSVSLTFSSSSSSSSARDAHASPLSPSPSPQRRILQESKGAAHRLRAQDARAQARPAHRRRGPAAHPPDRDRPRGQRDLAYQGYRVVRLLSLSVSRSLQTLTSRPSLTRSQQAPPGTRLADRLPRLALGHHVRADSVRHRDPDPDRDPGERRRRHALGVGVRAVRPAHARLCDLPRGLDGRAQRAAIPRGRQEVRQLSPSRRVGSSLSVLADEWVHARSRGVPLYVDERGHRENVGDKLEAVHPVIRINPVTGCASFSLDFLVSLARPSRALELTLPSRTGKGLFVNPVFTKRCVCSSHSHRLERPLTNAVAQDRRAEPGRVGPHPRLPRHARQGEPRRTGALQVGGSRRRLVVQHELAAQRCVLFPLALSPPRQALVGFPRS